MDVSAHDVTCGNNMPAFLAHPAAGGPYPTIVLMHERYGLVQHTRDQALRCARDGFAVLAPNFFFARSDQKRLNAGELRYDMSDPEAIALMKAAVETLKKYRVADPRQLAIAGYCQTGRHPLVFAAEIPIRAAVIWYGAAGQREWQVNATQPKPLDDLIGAITCPVFGAFGEADHLISLDDVRRLRNALEAHQKSYEIHVYKGAPHGWLNDTMPGRYRKAEAEAGWAAQQRFLGEVFGGGYDGETVRWRFTCDSSADYDFSKNVRLE
jgi:carboxymethylenebutenolidase